MTLPSRRYRDRLLAWLRDAVAGGWLEESEVQGLRNLETAGADQLFEGGSERPLTVGFFGGTGVGKSSLLNRLVGETVAEVGVERPTSTVVTLYAHEEYPLERLETLFPVERVRVLTHPRAAYREVVWIDMPDIDSVEQSNRDLVLEWLPYIDWLVYVVSPERYRDDVGWRVLKARGHRHHWLFVINRWDTGSAGQVDDFTRLLRDEGIADPLVLKTSCVVEDADRSDDFPLIKETVDRAVAQYGLRQLQAIGEQARLRDLETLCDRYAGELGDDARWRRFVDRGQALVAREMTVIGRSIHDEAVLETARVSDRPGAGIPAEIHQPSLPGSVRDRIQDLESSIALSVEALPRKPVIRATSQVTASLAARLEGVLRDAFREGTARPGSTLRRRVVAGLRGLVYGLPLIACAAIAYIVVTRYRSGLAESGSFLGVDFLVHSLMILGLAALVPYLLVRLLRPSVRRAIVKQADAGLRQVQSEVKSEWRSNMDDLLTRVEALHGSLASIRAVIQAARDP